MMDVEEIKKYLPKYLSAEHYLDLIEELKSFPNNIDGRFYTSYLDKNIIYQGDGIQKMPIIDLHYPSNGMKEVPCIILSNTCDIDTNNIRYFSSNLLYAPIIDLSRYINTLKGQHISEQKIVNHIHSIMKQECTQIFFLPQNSYINDSIVFLDRILNIDNQYINRETLDERRLFSLSDYGFYMLTLKLSIHFSRIQEKINRGMNIKDT